MFTDPIGDMIARIRNGQQARKGYILCPASKMKEGVLKVLKDEGYIENFDPVEGENNKKDFKIYLKFFDGRGAIKEIKRVSKPGCRIYSGALDIPKTKNGLGIVILSTPKGIVSDYEARNSNIGGEVLCTVY
jgi:small subunit ribosomal protein S8